MGTFFFVVLNIWFCGWIVSICKVLKTAKHYPDRFRSDFHKPLGFAVLAIVAILWPLAVTQNLFFPMNKE